MNEEHRLLAETAREFLAAKSPVAALRRLRDTRDALGYDPALWAEIVGLGWTAMVLSEEHGGLDFGYRGLGSVFESIGRNLAATPLLSTVVLGGGLLHDAGSEAQRAHWLPRVVDGSALFALALDEGPRHDPAAVRTSARQVDGGWVLDGEKWFVLDGHIADRLLVVARSAGAAGDHGGLSLFLVDPASPGVARTRTWMVDSRNAARVTLSQVRVDAEDLIGPAHEGAGVLEATLDRARVCLAAEALGVVGEAFDRTVAYLKERVQFDVPIGSFQALQHRAARLYVEIELLRSCVAAALDALDHDSAQAALLASLAKARAADLSERALNEAVQLHGGVGVTDALDIGLFLKRGRALQQTFGDAVYHRGRWARLSGF